MFFQSRAFMAKKWPDFVWIFLISKNSQKCSKKPARITKSGFKKAKLATLDQGTTKQTPVNTTRSQRQDH